MPCNKFMIGDKVIIDLSNITVRPDRLKIGVTAHDADGNLIVGTALTDDRIFKHEIKFKARQYDINTSSPVGSSMDYWMYAYINIYTSYSGPYTSAKDVSKLKNAGMYDSESELVWYFMPEENIGERILTFGIESKRLYLYLDNDITYNVPYWYDTVTLYGGT